MNQNSRAHFAAFCLLAAVVPSTALAVSLANGNFATGDFTGWTLDTDGGPGSSSDFSVIGAPGTYSARIGAD